MVSKRLRCSGRDSSKNKKKILDNKKIIDFDFLLFAFFVNFVTDIIKDRIS